MSLFSGHIRLYSSTVLSTFLVIEVNEVTTGMPDSAVADSTAITQFLWTKATLFTNAEFENGAISPSQDQTTARD
jgi:hypothetical protein